mmetsp:Transcript_30084/g.57997  ORF Transcript_30084/g.57997 Transcript_30084/m.57997 type:complete len:84 (-) Transcript_30084:2087-2338(-)
MPPIQATRNLLYIYSACALQPMCQAIARQGGPQSSFFFIKFGKLFVTLLSAPRRLTLFPSLPSHVGALLSFGTKGRTPSCLFG